jgi:ubiquinone/menaquinone biosynthesis C-methylase UbiE
MFENIKIGKALEKENLKKVFVEIGTSYSPITVRGNRVFGKDELYIGLDIDPRNIENAKKATENIGGQENKNFITADASSLPLTDGSAQEIFIGNVFGDPRIPLTTKEKFLSEAKRVLSEEGKIIILETTTPANFLELKTILNKEGFKLEKVIRPDVGHKIDGYKKEDLEWEQSVAPFKIKMTNYSSSHFLLYVKKIPE